jgi:type IV secretory pathway VirJ component
MTRIALAIVCVAAAAVDAAAGERLALTVRGKALSLELYRPAAAAPKATVLIAGGDVGWVGLAVDLAGFLSERGYAVVGINTRQYLAAFTAGADHVTTSQITGDYGTIVQALRDRGVVRDPIVVAGVSEGAALAVLAGAPSNHAWVKGVITIGLPPTAELAWRWKDALSWVTKKDAEEPSFAPREFVGAIAPVPLWMIQSTKDEYVTEADFRAIEGAARAPKRLVLVDASNHRFTDRLPLLRQHVLDGLDWVRDPR